MPLAFAPDERHPMVDALLRPRVPRWEELNRAIDERDDMLDFAMKLMGYDRDAALANYFQNGIEQFHLVRHIARWRGTKPRRMLDFASGYGRLTRFLIHDHLAEDVTVSDIVEGAMQFQAEQFAVRTILSTTLPEQFQAPDRYDLIFVASLFTHLPPVTFASWLRRLADLLAPEGMLIFSVHDESLAPERVAEGIKFESYSESRVLDGNEYGSTWVTEEFVRARVEAIDPSWACVRLPRALSDWQDVYVISPSPIAEAQPRRAPKAFLETCAVAAEGIRFSGWAFPVQRIEVRVDDQVVAMVRSFGERDDVARMHGLAEASAGWTCLVPRQSVRSFRYQVVTVSAFSGEGVERILFLGTIDAAARFIAIDRARVRDREKQDLLVDNEALKQRIAAGEHQRRELERQIAAGEHRHREQEQRIAAMRASRFWKAREQWFRLKRAAGLTKEP
jgi:SAM-dependent methyltransferase